MLQLSFLGKGYVYNSTWSLAELDLKVSTRYPCFLQLLGIWPLASFTSDVTLDK